MTFHQLLSQDLDELISLTEEHPYVSLYAVAAAKKAKLTQDNRYEKLLSRAAVRVPSRQKLKEIMFAEVHLGQAIVLTENENQPIEKEGAFSEEAISQPLVEEQLENNTKLSHQEAKEIVSNLRNTDTEPLKEATEVDNGEIVLNNPLTPKPVNLEELPEEELVVDGSREFVEVEWSAEEANQESEVVADELKLSHEEAKLVVNNLRQVGGGELQQATEVDDGEIVLDNPQTPKPVEVEELPEQELVVDGNQKYVEVEWSAEENSEESVQPDIEVEIIQADEDAVMTSEEESTQTQKEEEISFAGFGSGRSQFGRQQQDLADFQFVEDKMEDVKEDIPVVEEKSSEQDVSSLRSISLPIEDDHIDEIGEALVIEEEIKTDDVEVEIYQIGSEPVSSLANDNEEESMYKKIVRLLQDDVADKEPQRPEPAILDVDYENINQLQSTPEIIGAGANSDTDFSTAEKELDDELESLYAQAAYEAELEIEIAQAETVEEEIDWRRPSLEESREEEVQELVEETEPIIQEFVEVPEAKTKEELQAAEVNELADPSQTHSFSGWLGQLSNMGADFAQDQKEHQQRQNEIAQRTQPSLEAQKNEEKIAEQTQEIKDDRPELTTKQVQELARKSMQPSKAFYTETLAYVYELQEKWGRAIEVYEQLSLQNPQKSSYFASQIKLLKEKLK